MRGKISNDVTTSHNNWFFSSFHLEQRVVVCCVIETWVEDVVCYAFFYHIETKIYRIIMKQDDDDLFTDAQCVTAMILNTD